MRYFQWTESGYHCGNMLMDCKQIKTLLHYHHRKEEAYSTVQDYESDGAIKGCYLYFDIDNKNLEHAYQTMIDTVFHVEQIYDCKCLVYFSGNKGFHIIAPVYIIHSRCHEIVKMIAKENRFDVDLTVYRSKAWFRCNSTWNPKGQRYKTLMSDTESLKDILERSKAKRKVVEINFNRTVLDIESYIKKLPEFKKNISEYGHEFAEDMHPCMATIWNNDEPPPGQAHWFLNIMARHCHRSNLSLEEAEALFESHHFWSKQNPRDYKKVIASVYRYGRDAIGCKNGRDADLLKDFCSKLCPLNEETKIYNIFKKEL